MDTKLRTSTFFLEVEGFLVGQGRQLRQKRTHSVSPRVGLVCPKFRPRQGEEQLFLKKRAAAQVDQLSRCSLSHDRDRFGQRNMLSGF